MKLDKQHLQYISNVINTAESLGIQEVIIEPQKVRAIDPDRQVFILHTDDVPSFPFTSIGISRLNAFQTRLSTMISLGDVDIDVTMNNNEQQPFVRSLTLKANKCKVDFRCNDPETITAPKAYRGEWMFEFSLPVEVVDIISKGKRAMKSDEVTIHGDLETLKFAIKDTSSGDVFEHSISVNLKQLTDIESFSYTYPISLFTQLIKQNTTDIDIKISSKGIINTLHNNLNVFLFPRS